ncbi:MAG TPA: SURF1 family cytochrome oxidase biogenesis protein [Allosphingosinicella sp.]|uniref:SURF1 family cytochrome oxidase biogenesis protein n=1 Tax=Allosphingosinicella sp. TaxID=2823234 RepID=UPI002ED9B5DA
MKRLPILPTIIVAAAVAVMIGLGVWQLQRAEWKERLIAEIDASDHYRQQSVTCTVDAKPEVRAGRSAKGESGYRYLVPCSSRTAGGDEIAITEGLIDLGWAKHPNLLPHVRLTRTFTGTYAAGEAASRQILVLEEPLPPLEKSALPTAADIPNNHMAYALQWFFFAAAAAIIYILALRRRRQRLA